MKGKWDDFIDDMVKDNTPPSNADPKEVNMNELGKMMEEQVKKAFESVSKKQEPSEPAEPKEPEEPDVTDDNVDDMNDEREDN